MLTLFVLCVFAPACAVEEHPGLVSALCWVLPPLADGPWIPSFLAVASTRLLSPVVCGSDGGHQVLLVRGGRGGEGKGDADYADTKA